MSQIRVALLGATGSIGTQTLDVARMHPDKVKIVALAAGRRVDELVASALEFGVKHVALGDSSVKDAPALAQLDPDVTVEFGPEAVARLTQLDDVDLVLNALSGEAGMRAS